MSRTFSAAQYDRNVFFAASLSLEAAPRTPSAPGAQAKNLFNWEVPTDETASPRTPRRKVGKPIPTQYKSSQMADYAGQ